ncbi:T9SS type A sorting domain-containing protein [Chryseobacterium phocaeense]|uniref:T9SS type A sorting domain-containing protein n=1 Tax=Chryseobacterium phocaeense TaxID=1816690 RepID=UPI0009B990D3|nr:T9SS type A sorting domain-containing protein [Chryseobacterium phocaeense]
MVSEKSGKNNTSYMLPQNSEMGSPTMTFTPTPGSPATTNMSSPVCGASIWGMIYLTEITPNSFAFWTYGAGANQTCTIPENISFFNQYTNYFAFNSTQHNYQITYSGNTKNLVATNHLGDQAFYDSGVLGTKETTVKNTAVKIYPNPVKNGFIGIEATDSIEWIKVYSSEGKLIQQNSTDDKIDVSSLPKGGYFLEIKSPKGISRHQFLKE